MASGSELWTTTEVANYLGVKPGTVSAYRHRGQMPPPLQTLRERTHLWEARTIREWNARRGVGANSAYNGESREVTARADPHEWLEPVGPVP